MAQAQAQVLSQGIHLHHMPLGLGASMVALQGPTPAGWSLAQHPGVATGGPVASGHSGLRPSIPSLAPTYGSLQPQVFHPAAAAAQAAQAALQQQHLQQQIHAQVAALQAAGVPANQISAALQVTRAFR